MDVNTDNNHLLTEDYTLTKIVYVNSANHAYSEIQLDSHLAMFGANNAGKTASLAGTKLLLFPEVNFRKCETKFNFEGKSGLYSMEDSFEFYFPALTSFIIQEVRNPEGTFCMVLHKSKDYGYGRYFIPVPYDGLRHLFWREETNKFAENISIEAIKQFSKTNDGIYLNDAKEIRRYMFESLRADRKTKRFCVLPLKDSGPGPVEAFKHIYQLAFSTNTVETDTLPSAIATLIEMGRGREQEKLNADLDGIDKVYKALYAREEALQNTQNHLHTFHRANEHYVNLAPKYKQYSKNYVSLKAAYELARKETQPKLAEMTTKQSKEALILSRYESQSNALSGQIKKLEVHIERDDSGIEKLETKIAATKKLIASYGSLGTIENVERVLNDDIKELRNDVDSLQTDKSIKEALKNKINEQNTLISEQKRLNTLINNQASAALFQLPSEAASTLYSLNSGFGKVAVTLTAAQIDIIVKFAELFSITESEELLFCGEKLGQQKSFYDAIEQLDTHKKELKTVADRLSDTYKELDELRNVKTEEEVDALIEKKSFELAGYSSDLQKIRALQDNETDLFDRQTVRKARQHELANKRQEFGKEIESFNKQKAIVSEINEKIEVLTKTSISLDKYEQILNKAKTQCAPDYDVDLDEAIEMNDASMNTLQHNGTDCALSISRLISELTKLLNAVPIDGTDIHKERFTFSDCRTDINAYRAVYDSLAYDLRELRTSIINHNQFINSQLHELKTAKDFLKSFISEINKELNNQSISNLSEIELLVTINPAFESLLQTLSTQNSFDDALLSPAFYGHINKFVNEYFDRRTNRLKLNDIIEKITYSYVMAETKERVKKSQSGGTTTTITAFVISVLLKRITPEYVNLNMPIVVDEIGTLDRRNMLSTLEQIESHGFSMFCATPTFMSHLCQSVKRWVQIDKMVISEPMVPNCHMNILPEDIASFREVQHET